MHKRPILYLREPDVGYFLLNVPKGFFGESEKFWAPENLPVVTQGLGRILGKRRVIEAEPGEAMLLRLTALRWNLGDILDLPSSPVASAFVLYCRLNNQNLIGAKSVSIGDKLAKNKNRGEDVFLNIHVAQFSFYDVVLASIL